MRLEEARRILEANDRGGYTVPARGLYPFQWLWDSGFTALGWLTFKPRRAWEEMESLLRGQWENGFLPHIVFHGEDPSYFPGPDVWGVDRRPPTSGITQPPVLAPVVLHLARTTGDLDRAAGIYPRLLAFHRFLHRFRDPEGQGLVAVLHPWESGMDNSPAWDLPLERVPAHPLPSHQRRDTLFVSPEERPRAVDYQRYLYLVHLFRRLGYDPEACYEASPFKVVDVGFNALLLWADEALAELARVLGEDPSEAEAWLERGMGALEGLWDGVGGVYRSWDALERRPLPLEVLANFLPLLLPLPPSRVEALVEALRAWADAVPYALPTVPPWAPYFEPRRYWRGPVWAPMNWLIAQGLIRHGFHREARRLLEDLERLVQGAGFREYYHPLTGEGLGGRVFSWTAALYLKIKTSPGPFP